GYGDCKDMSCLAVSLLRLTGVKAYPALLLTKDEGQIEQDLVYLGFNHMIVYVEGVEAEAPDSGGLWLDLTAAPFTVGYLPPPDRGANALVVEGDDAVWKTIPEAMPIETRISSRTEITVDPSGNLTGRSLVTHTGDWGFMATRRLAAMSGSDLRQEIEDMMRGYLGGAALDSCRVASLDKSALQCAVAADFEASSPAVVVGSNMVIRPDFVSSMLFEFVDMQGTSERRVPVCLPFAWVEADTMSLEIPAGWAIEKLPFTARSSDMLGSYSVSAAADSGKIVVVAERRLGCAEIGTDRFKEFVEFWTRAKQMAAQEIVLKRP
ncbi:MAG: hypothetical protein WAW06_07975, partial [bacterium]